MHLHLLTEDDLDTREAERDLYRRLAAAAERQRLRELTADVGRVPLLLVQSNGGEHVDTEMACTTGRAPSVPTRINRRR